MCVTLFLVWAWVGAMRRGAGGLWDSARLLMPSCFCPLPFVPDLATLKDPNAPATYKRAIAEDVAEAFMQGVIDDDAYPW
jgi:hypothetical protein